jgi:hypothetical protein
MHRYLWTTLFCIAALLLVGGCNKGTKEKKVNTAKIEETAPSLVAIPDAETRDTTVDEEAMLRDQAMQEELRSELLSMLPDFEFTHDAASDKISGKGIPEQGVPVSTLVGMLDKRLQKLTTKPGKAEYQQVIRLMLTQFKSAGMTSTDLDGPPKETVKIEQDAAKDASDFGLKKAPKVYGEWRSVREEGEKYTIEHDDKYFKQLLVYYEGDTMYSSFVKGQQIKNDIFDYKYDASQGVLNLTAKSGKFTMKLLCFIRESEPGMLYVQQQAGQAYTVYEKIGRGEEPQTEEELQNFLDQQREIGGGGGTAKDGKGK